ncbi:hypothetical protein BpHYR1_045895 [Brachionus plicatilis]|uniref:Uncharacterized protein n=1 Tax=Brachionus plicatilis TaxID=10195 RepID=A0A3M7S7T6_BRAPC|nr:hypothetical protein BpHYR1_045895 [Brachionus plicatilis]
MAQGSENFQRSQTHLYSKYLVNIVIINYDVHQVVLSRLFTQFVNKCSHSRPNLRVLVASRAILFGIRSLRIFIYTSI